MEAKSSLPGTNNLMADNNPNIPASPRMERGKVLTPIPATIFAIPTATAVTTAVTTAGTGRTIFLGARC